MGYRKSGYRSRTKVNPWVFFGWPVEAALLLLIPGGVIFAFWRMIGFMESREYMVEGAFGTRPDYVALLESFEPFILFIGIVSGYKLWVAARKWVSKRLEF